MVFADGETGIAHFVTLWETRERREERPQPQAGARAAREDGFGGDRQRRARIRSSSRTASTSVEAASSAGISREQLQLAARNHGLPLEALRHDVTPVGLHYLLTHFDIPMVDPATWRLEVGGSSSGPRPHAGGVRGRPETMPVTLECAGNGRALLEPHVPASPGSRRRSAPPSGRDAARRHARGGGLGAEAQRDRLHRPGPRHPGRHRAPLRAQPAARRGAAPRGLARLRDQRQAAATAARLSAPAHRPGAGTA